MELDKKTRDKVHQLHKGRGVRRSDLTLFMRDSGLTRLWGISREESRLVVLGTAIYRLDQVIRTFTDQRVVGAAAVIYNLLPDPDLHDRELGERLAVLRERCPHEKGYSQSSLSRMIRVLGDAVERSLYLPPQPIPDADLLAIVARERDFEDELNGRIGPDTFARTVRQTYTAPDDAHSAFLRLSVFVPVSHSDDLIIAHTPDGHWLCVFSTPETQRAHQKATPPQPWSGRCTTMLGAELARTVTRRWQTVGVVVDPAATPSSDPRTDLTRTLRIPPNELSRLAGA